MNSLGGSSLPPFGNCSTRKKKANPFIIGTNPKKTQSAKLPTLLPLPSKLSNYPWALRQISCWSTSENHKSSKSITFERHWIFLDLVSSKISTCLSCSTTKTKKIRSLLSTISIKNQGWSTPLSSMKKGMIICTSSAEESKALVRKFRKDWREKRYPSSRRKRKSKNSRNRGQNDSFLLCYSETIMWML